MGGSIAAFSERQTSGRDARQDSERLSAESSFLYRLMVSCDVKYQAKRL